MTNKTPRTTAGLRDALFDQLDQLRGENPNPQLATAVSKVAAQIINVARAEMDFHAKMNKDDKLCDDFMTGTLRLGSQSEEFAASVGKSATAA